MIPPKFWNLAHLDFGFWFRDALLALTRFKDEILRFGDGCK
jgi:hypothetical protein